MKEFEFPWPNEEKGYHIFAAELEDDPLVLFHATPKRNLQAILQHGFKAFPPLSSVSYAKSSVDCLTHLFAGGKTLTEEAIVIIVRFEKLQQHAIKEEHSEIKVYDPGIQPTILGYCTIPVSYAHR